MPAPPRLFISFASADARWMNELKTHMHALAADTHLDAWDDTRIPPGAIWEGEIVEALAQADLAILLVSRNFLASRYILHKELPALLRNKKCLRISVGACVHERNKLESIEAANDPNKPLDGFLPSKRNAEWNEICKKILKACV